MEKFSSIEDLVADTFEAEDPNLKIFEETNEHFDNVIEGIESIINQFRDKGMVDIGGNEAYAIGALKADGMNWNVNAGYENFVTDGAKKLYEMILNMLAAIKNFFFGKSGDDNLSMQDTAKVINDKESTIEKSADARDATALLKTGQMSTAELDKYMTEEAPKAPSQVNSTSDEVRATLAEVSAAIAPERAEVKEILVKAGVTSPSEQQKVIREAIAEESNSEEADDAFKKYWDGIQQRAAIQKGDSVAKQALNSFSHKLNAYLELVKKNEEHLTMDFGQWSGWYTLQNSIEKGLTGDAIECLLELAKSGSDMERALNRDTVTLDKMKDKLKQNSEAGIVRGIMADIAIYQQVLSREANVAAEVKTSQRKLKKALNRQLAAIEKAKANVVVSCVKAKLKKKK